MNREEIKRFALAAGVPVGITGGNPTWEQIERFVSLVAAAEREKCARIAEDDWNFDSTECGTDVANDIASAIRTSVL